MRCLLILVLAFAAACSGDPSGPVPLKPAQPDTQTPKFVFDTALRAAFLHQDIVVAAQLAHAKILPDTEQLEYGWGFKTVGDTSVVIHVGWTVHDSALQPDSTWVEQICLRATNPNNMALVTLPQCIRVRVLIPVLDSTVLKGCSISPDTVYSRVGVDIAIKCKDPVFALRSKKGLFPGTRTLVGLFPGSSSVDETAPNIVHFVATFGDGYSAKIAMNLYNPVFAKQGGGTMCLEFNYLGPAGPAPRTYPWVGCPPDPRPKP
jgi:hypothetical protein